MLLEARHVWSDHSPMNEDKPATHTDISAATLEEITEKQRKAPCTQVHPVYLWLQRRMP